MNQQHQQKKDGQKNYAEYTRTHKLLQLTVSSVFVNTASYVAGSCGIGTLVLPPGQSGGGSSPTTLVTTHAHNMINNSASFTAISTPDYVYKHIHLHNYAAVWKRQRYQKRLLKLRLFHSCICICQHISYCRTRWRYRNRSEPTHYAQAAQLFTLHHFSLSKI